MNLVEWLQHLMTNFGAVWVMWLMIGLSVASVTIMLERGWFYFSIRDDIPQLAQSLRDRLRDDDLPAALSLLEKSPSAEAAVVVAGLREADRGVKYNWRQSIVDLMKLLDLDSSLGARKELAQELGYKGALDGSAEMNVWLHKQVMEKLAEGGGKVPASLKG